MEDRIFTTWKDAVIWYCTHPNYDLIEAHNIFNETECGDKEYSYTLLTVQQIY